MQIRTSTIKLTQQDKEICEKIMTLLDGQTAEHASNLLEYLNDVLVAFSTVKSKRMIELLHDEQKNYKEY